MMIVEVTHSTGAKKDAKKAQELMSEYDVPEGFVYDYKKRIWQRFELGSSVASTTSNSAILKVDLSTFLG